MALSSMALWSLVLLAGCPEEPAARCGDGAVDPGEDSTSCCVDVGCELGACDRLTEEVEPACLMPWQSQCLAFEGACLGGGPLACEIGDTPPRYDCQACGCSDADACVDGVCYDAATRAAARDRDELPDDLELSDYLALPLELRTHDAQPLAAIAAQHAEEPRADPRRNTFVIGLDARAPDAAALQGAWLAGLGVVGAAITEERCVEPDALWPDGARVQVVPVDAAARATCAWPGMFIDCVLPLAADCVLGGGSLAETAVFLDLDVVLQDADGALLVRAGRAPPSLRDATLEEAIRVWLDAAGTVPVQPGLAIAAQGGPRYAAAYASDEPHVSWILVNARSSVPLRLRSYRAVWSDPPSQQFLIDHDIQTRACGFTLIGDGDDPPWLPSNVYLSCANAGATLTANVETAGFTLVDVTTSGG